jgi:hypothetical protein
MKKKFLFLVAVLAVFALDMQRPAAAISTCSNAYCAGAPTQQCICPPNTHYHGRVMFCNGWYVDCQGF